MGTTTYTATFEGITWAATQTKNVQDIAALGHDYKLTSDPTWAQNGSTCTAYGRCSRCAERTSANGVVVSEIKTNATCTEAGWTTYTATFVEYWVPEEMRVLTKDVQDISAIGHDWFETEYAWAEDGSSCTATRTCANSAACTETLIAEISSEVKTAATCVAKGWTTYTATFQTDWATTQTKDVENIDATGEHSFTVEVSRTPATCMAEGLVIRKCATCDQTQEEILPVDPDNHTGNNTTGVNASAPTCTDKGYTGDTVCECGVTITAGTAIAATGHKDTDFNHICDNNCGKTDMGFHSDAPYDEDHVCDYGCGEVLEECDDLVADGDHVCDVCGKENITEHTYRPADCEHPSTCAECGDQVGQALGHKDENLDHVCDNGCGEYQGVHEDTNSDHLCEYGCNERIGECKDASDDQDHVCDYGCGTVWESCSDKIGDGDHDCDVCGKENHSSCFDSATDVDHLCDDCGAKMAECEDAEGDGDHYCDICGADNITACSGGEANCQNAAVCDECGNHYGNLNPDNHTTTASYLKDNGNGTHTRYHECCDQQMETENHTYTEGNCKCGNVQTLTVSVLIDGSVWKSVQVTYGGSVNLSQFGTPTKTDHTFNGYTYEDGTAVSGQIKNITSDLKIVTAWILNTDIYYVITWVVDGVSIMQELPFTSAPVYGFGEDPVKASTADNHFIFAGWALTENGKVLSSLPAVTGDATYYAIFTAGEHADTKTPDHNCDTCGYVMSGCSDVLTDDDHDCDVCGKKLSSCADVETPDHKCDICDCVMTECVDENTDYICDWCGAELPRGYLRGDVDDDGDVDSDDAIYLLYYTFQPEEYPINQSGDMDGDGDVDSDDAIYLLYFTFQPDDYPLSP